MRARRQRRGPALALLGLALAAPGAPAADSVPGNTLDPTGLDATRVPDPLGMTRLRPHRRRTPTGFLYPYPLEAETFSELGAGWRGGASVELGGLFTTGDSDEARFQRYADWSEGFLLNSFRLAFQHPESGFYGEAHGGAVSRDDQYYWGELARPGLVRLRGQFSGIPRTYAKDGRSLFLGAGTDTLSLPVGLTPGDNTDDEVSTAFSALVDRTFVVQRDDLGLSLDVRPQEALRLFARYGRQSREGDRPFGGSLVYEAQGPARSVETTQPVDDVTHDFAAGLELGRERWQTHLVYNGSFYRNGVDSLTWDNPFRLPSFNAQNVRQARFALGPDNDWHNVKGDVSIQLPHAARLAATASWSRMRQNDDLLPPTVNEGSVGGFLNTVNLSEWNGVDALARPRADATVDTLLLNADLRLRPWKPLRLGARARYFDRRNRTDYTAFNPANGRIGYVSEDGALASGTPSFDRVFAPEVAGEADDWRYRSTPYGYDQLLLEATADVRVRPKTKLGLRYAWERRRRDHRERQQTRESRIRAELTSRELSRATLRLSYEYGDRDGSAYDPNPYTAFYVSSLEDFEPLFGQALPPFTLAQLRKYDLADRRQHQLDLRANLLLRNDMDLGLAALFRSDDYAADYGLEWERSGNVSLEWSFQPSPDVNAHLFGTWEQGVRRMSTINDAQSIVGDPSDPNAGGAVFPFDHAWSLETRSRSGSLGAGFWLRLLERLILESNYRFIVTVQRLDYDYASDGALAGVGADAAGSGFPQLRTEDHQLQTSLRLQIAQPVALRFFHRYQRGEIEDFQQDGLEAGVVASSLFLGHVDRDYEAHVVGAMLQLRY